MKKKKKVEIEVKATEEQEVKSSLTNPIHGVKFWLFAFAAALLLVIGVWILIDRSFGSSLAIAFTGIAIIIFGIVRIIPLVKSRKTGLAKFSTILEIIINLGLGAFLIFAATEVKKDTGLGDFVDSYYKYFLGFVFYAKAIFYFVNSSLLKEETNKFEFWLHILIITIAVVIFACDFDASSLALFIAILALICAVFLIGMSGGSYYNYRKTINKKPKKEKEMSNEETNENEETLILPTDKENDNETYIS